MGDVKCKQLYRPLYCSEGHLGALCILSYAAYETYSLASTAPLFTLCRFMQCSPHSGGQDMTAGNDFRSNWLSRSILYGLQMLFSHYRQKHIPSLILLMSHIPGMWHQIRHHNKTTSQSSSCTPSNILVYGWILSLNILQTAFPGDNQSILFCGVIFRCSVFLLLL